jgi:cell division protease FtsH
MEVVRRKMGNDFGLTKAEIEERVKKEEAEKANDEMEIVHVDEEPKVSLPEEESKELDE